MGDTGRLAEISLTSCVIESAIVTVPRMERIVALDARIGPVVLRRCRRRRHGTRLRIVRCHSVRRPWLRRTGGLRRRS